MMKKRILFTFLLLLGTVLASAQTQRISGTVTSSADGQPVLGASVLVKGTTIGTAVGLDGSFELSVPQNAVLEVASIGYTTREVAVNGRSRLEIVLDEDNEFLDEVVVVGYGTMKKSDLTGSVISANVKDFEKSPNTNLLQSLQGTVPGLNVGQVSSAGSSPELSIRGKNTISGNSSVLIVLDGIIYNGDISSLNPADIESVDILKDASATAVYGAQAANGVLLVTTKRGKAGKVNVSFSSSYSIQNPTRNYRTMNRAEMLDFDRKVLWNEAYTAESGYTVENPSFSLASRMPDAWMLDDSGNIISTDYDWWGNFTRTGSVWENQVNVSGGSESVQYLLSLGNVSQKNYLLNDDFKRNTIRVNLDVKPYSWLKVGVQAFGAFLNRDGQETYLPFLIAFSPLSQPYDENGELDPFPMVSARENPFNGAYVDDYDRSYDLFANLYAEVTLPVKGLTYRLNAGQNLRLGEHFYFSKFAQNLNGEGYKNHSHYYDYTIDNIVNFVRSFGRHDVNATFVYGASKREYSYTGANSKIFPRMTLGYNSLGIGGTQTVNSSAWEEALLYQMARVNYKYDNRYLFTATVRRDGFSGFAANNKFAVFPSVAGAWVLSEEDFFNVPFIDNLKLRAGWGVSGNQTSRYASLARVNSSIGYIFGDGGSGAMRQELATMQNADLKWEKTAGINVGMDFALLSNRLSGSVEYYNTTTRDLLFNVSIPSITGFTSIASNVGSIRNSGIEFFLTSHNISTRDFEWTTTFNISHNDNRIASLIGEDSNGDGVEDDMVASSLFIGQPLSAIWDYEVDGIWQIGDDIPEGYHPGNYRIVDYDGDGQITTNDRHVIGKADPGARMGLMNTFRYKNLSLSFFINAVVGGRNAYIGQNTNSLLVSDNDTRYNHIKEEADLFWSPLNPNGIYANAAAEGALVPRRYEKRDFARLQDLTLSYDLPKSWMDRIGISGVNVYFNAKNLLTLTGWHGWDPEPNFYVQDGNQVSNITRATGSGFGNRPVMRSFTGGIIINF